jgi:hypothetical protein
LLKSALQSELLLAATLIMPVALSSWSLVELLSLPAAWKHNRPLLYATVLGVRTVWLPPKLMVTRLAPFSIA